MMSEGSRMEFQGTAISLGHGEKEIPAILLVPGGTDTGTELRSLGKYGVCAGAPLLSVVCSFRQHHCTSISRLLSESPSTLEPESTGLWPSRQASLSQLVGSGRMFTWGLVKSERGSKSLDPHMPAASAGTTPSTQSPEEMSPVQSCSRAMLLRYGL